jgi:hypothetical protein
MGVVVLETCDVVVMVNLFGITWVVNESKENINKSVKGGTGDGYVRDWSNRSDW